MNVCTCAWWKQAAIPFSKELKLVVPAATDSDGVGSIMRRI